jgi:4-hydroxybenzoate polyprenyltransferase
MYSLRFYFVNKTWGDGPFVILKNEFDYFLLVFSTVIIAAGGNIINDYFDVKADKINKPHKVIIGKHIKPRLAIVWHWILNFIAFSIAVYLSLKFNTFWYLFIHLLSINLLWIYSMKLKRKFLIGNIVVSLLTALVPILAGIFLIQLKWSVLIGGNIDAINPISFFTHKKLDLIILLIFSSFAFFLNLVREIIKDVEDIEGDKLLRAKTIPMVLGERKARIISLILLIFILISAMIGLYLFVIELKFQLRIIDIILFGLISLFLFLAIFFLKSKERKQLKYADRSLKVAMIIGSLLPLIWSLIVVKV